MKYDIIVLGGGPGGYVAAIRGAQLGAHVCVVERHKLGGTCLNRGCIPTKALLFTTELLDRAKRAEVYGLKLRVDGIDMEIVQDWKRRVVERLVAGLNRIFDKRGIELLSGTGKLIANDALEVKRTSGDTTLVRGKAIIVATGSEPLTPPVFGVDGRTVITSNEALELTAVPESLLVIGGGAIGCELASIYAVFGSRVTLIEMLPQLLPGEEPLLASHLQRSLEKKGIVVFTDSTIESINKGGKGVIASLSTGEEVEASLALVAVGRQLNLENIGLDEVGIEVEEGAVSVNERMQTNLEGIYAIGDITGKMLLAHVASEQGIVAAENAVGGEKTMSYAAVPRATYAIPEVASVGLTESEALNKGYSVKVGNFPFAASGRALTMGEGEGYVKVIADSSTDTILGIHIAGPQAATLIAEATLALNMRASASDLASTIHAHPTLPEALREAAEDVAKQAIHSLRG